MTASEAAGLRVRVVPGDSAPGKEQPPALIVKLDAVALPPLSLTTWLITVSRPGKGSVPEGAGVPVTLKFVKLALLVLAPTSKIIPASPEPWSPNAARLPVYVNVPEGVGLTALPGSVSTACVKNLPVTVKESPLTRMSIVSRYQMPSLISPLTPVLARSVLPVDVVRSPDCGTRWSSIVSVLPASERTRARPNFPAPSLKSATSPVLLALVPDSIVSAATLTLPENRTGVAVAGSVSNRVSPFVPPEPELKFKPACPVPNVSLPRLMFAPLTKSRKRPLAGAGLLE